MTLALTPSGTDGSQLHTAAPLTPRRSLATTLREAVLIATVFVLYRQVRLLTSTDLDQAFTNADRIVGFERRFGLYSEAALQRLVLRSRFLIELLDHYYVFVHFTASFGFMLWIFLRHPDAWARIRTWFLGVTLAGLAIHVVFPLAPPRMLDSHGFVDTLHLYGPSIYSRDVTDSAANQLAAMPSLHFAWAAIVAVGFVAVRRTRHSWWMLLHPAFTLLAIVATANHYWLDALVGGVLVAAAVTMRPIRRTGSIRAAAPDRLAVATAASAHAHVHAGGGHTGRRGRTRCERLARRGDLAGDGLRRADVQRAGPIR